MRGSSHESQLTLRGRPDAEIALEGALEGARS